MSDQRIQSKADTTASIFGLVGSDSSPVVTIVAFDCVRQPLQHIGHDRGVDIQTKLVENEKVAIVALADDRRGVLVGQARASLLQAVDAPGAAEYGQGPSHEHADGEHECHREPHPHHQVDLLVEDIEHQHAQRVVHLHVARRAVRVDGALGHEREEVLHRVRDCLVVLVVATTEVEVLEDVPAISEESIVEESVVERNAHHQHGECHNLAGDVLEGIAEETIVMTQQVDHQLLHLRLANLLVAEVVVLQVCGGGVV